MGLFHHCNTLFLQNGMNPKMPIFCVFINKNLCSYFMPLRSGESHAYICIPHKQRTCTHTGTPRLIKCQGGVNHSVRDGVQVMLVTLSASHSIKTYTDAQICTTDKWTFTKQMCKSCTETECLNLCNTDNMETDHDGACDHWLVTLRLFSYCHHTLIIP